MIDKGPHSSFQTWKLNGALTVSSNYRRSTNAELIFSVNRLILKLIEKKLCFESHHSKESLLL